jgi:hypothetical protein
MDFDIADLLTTIVSGRARQVNQAEARAWVSLKIDLLPRISG